MPTLDFPRSRVAQLREHAAHLLDARKPGSDPEPLARALLAGLAELCTRWGLDGLLDQLVEDPADPAALADHPKWLPALVAQVRTAPLDDGGPRNAKPRLLADAVVAALGLTLTDDPAPALALGDDVRQAVVAALAAVIDPALAPAALREAIVAKGRALCEPEHLAAYEKLAAQLDERGLRVLKQPKIPLHAVQAVQRALTDARTAVFDGTVRAAIDRALPLLAAADAEAAARIDRPITARLTPRDVASLRARDANVPKAPAAFAQVVLDSLTDLAHLAWRAPERAVRPYGAKQTFALGELVEHPKFGQGTVTAVQTQRVVIEFADGPHTLVHVGPAQS